MAAVDDAVSRQSVPTGQQKRHRGNVGSMPDQHLPTLVRHRVEIAPRSRARGARTRLLADSIDLPFLVDYAQTWNGWLEDPTSVPVSRQPPILHLSDDSHTQRQREQQK